MVHSVDTSTAKLHHGRVWDDLLHGEETSVWADKAYVSAEREAAFAGPGKAWGVRARVEHPFRVIERQFGHVKTRYRGLAKNRAQLFTLFALGNRFLVRRMLMT